MIRTLLGILFSSLLCAQSPPVPPGNPPIRLDGLGVLKNLLPEDKSILLSLQNAHTSKVAFVAVAQNGKYVITTSVDKTNKVWETGFKKILHTFSTGDTITRACFINNDSAILLGGSRGTLYRYKLHSRQLDEIPYKFSGTLISIRQSGHGPWWILTSQLLAELRIGADSYECRELYKTTAVLNPVTGSLTFSELTDLQDLPGGNANLRTADGACLTFSSNGAVVQQTKTHSQLVLPSDEAYVMTNGNNFTLIGQKSVMYIYRDGKKYDKVFCNRIEHTVTGIVGIGGPVFVWVNDGGEITGYDAERKKIIFRKVFRKYSFTSLAFDAANHLLYLGEAGGQLSAFNLDNHDLLPIHLPYTGIEDLDYDFKNNRMVWGDNRGCVNSMEFESGRFKTRSLRIDNYEITAVKFSPLRNVILASGFNNRLCEIASGDTLRVVKRKKITRRPAIRNTGYVFGKITGHPIRHRIQVSEIALFKNDSLIGCQLISNKPFFLLRVMYDVTAWPKKPRFYGALTLAPAQNPAPNGKLKYWLNAGYFSGTGKNETRFATAEGPDAFLKAAVESHKGLFSGSSYCEGLNMLASSGRDGSIQVWKPEGEAAVRKICTIYPLGQDNKLMVNTENFYWGPQDILERVGFNFKGRYFFPDQFDFIYNRPDLVLKSIDSLKYRELISTFYNAYQKRLKKAGLAEKNIVANIDSLPVLTIKQVKIEANTAFFDVSLLANGRNIKRINVWNNGVPVFGEQGLAPLGRDETRAVAIPIVAGKNKLQFSALDKFGNEGVRITFILSGSENDKKADLYFVGLGCSEYKQQQFNLTYAAKDISDLNAVLQTSGHYNQVHSLMLVNNDLTRESIATIRKFLLQSRPNDQVIVFYAGHGVLDNKYNYYLTPANTDFSSPENSAIPYELLEAQMDSIAAYKKILLIDACHSGDLDKEDMATMANNSVAVNKDIKFRKIGSLTYSYSSNTTFELSRELFSDLKRGTGTTVISSAGGLEFAMEGKKWNNGLFTYCLINGIKTRKADVNHDRSISVSEIKKYVQEQVKLLSNGMQTPVTRNDNAESDYALW